MEVLLNRFEGQSNIIKKSMLLKSASLSKNSHVDALNNLNTDLTTLESMVQNIRNYLDEECKSLDQAEQLVKAMQSQQTRVNYMKENIPQQMPTAELKQNNQPAPQSSKQKQPKQEEPSKKPSSRAKSSKNSRTVEISKMEYVKVNEFDATPKYIRGRLTREQVNLTIDVMHTAMQKKYKILSMNRSKLSDQDLKRVTVYKESESKDTQGLQFVIEADFKDLANHKIDTSARTCFTILRHLGRLKEIRGGGVTRFVKV